MVASHPRDKASAVRWLAAGKSRRAAAEAAGVSVGTVAVWLRSSAFVAEVEAARVLYSQRPQDGRALVEHLAEVEVRFARPGPVRLRGGGVRVPVTFPAGAAPRQQERAVARALARGLRVAREAES